LLGILIGMLGGTAVGYCRRYFGGCWIKS